MYHASTLASSLSVLCKLRVKVTDVKFREATTATATATATETATENENVA